MDIISILESRSAELIPEDLDFFETELATGEGYSPEYQAQCRELIQKLRLWMKDGKNCGGKDRDAPAPKKGGTDGLTVSLSDLAPHDAIPAALSLTPAQIIRSDIAAMRDESAYKTKFKTYVLQHKEIDSAFVDEHYAFFRPWELDAIISVRQMTEEFLDKYFDALDHDKLARYQLFSESFFMKHFTRLNATIVLEQGKNEWRKKENRSKQLDVFLRLKGIR